MIESQWYLEVNGQKIGPFTLDHIQGLYADGEIRGENHVTSDQLEGQWITVQELVDSLRIAAPPPPSSDFSAAPPPPPEDDDDEEEVGIALPILESAEENSETSFPPSFESAGATKEEAEESAPPPPPEAAAVFNSDFQPPPRPPDLLSAAAAAEAAKKLAGSTSPSNAVIKTLPPTPIDEPSLGPTNDPAISMLSSLQLFKERQEKTTETYDPTMIIQGDMHGQGESSSPRMWMVAVIAGIILGSISWFVLKTLKNKVQAPAGSMTQISNHTAQPFSAPPARPVAPPVTNVTTPPNSAFRPAEGPHEAQHRMAPPRPLVAPSSAPAPVRQFEPPRDQQPPQIDTAQPNEVPPQPQYAPQYQAYPPPNGNGNSDPNNQQPQQPVVPQQPYVDPNNPQAPPVYPAGNENFQNGNPGAGPPPGAFPQGMPQGGPPPGADGYSAPSVPQQVPQEQQDLMLQQQQLNQQNQPPSQ